jgi:outer membrane protein assembly factor BamA
VTGNSRFTAEQIAAASGLAVGSRVDGEILQAAAAKLDRSGAFSEVKYSYSFTSKYWDMQLQVVEATQFLPCTFDNFVWFTQDQLLAAAKQASPLFDGMLPEAGSLKDDVATALTDFLRSQKLPSTVTATAAAGTGKQFAGYIFRVSDLRIPVRSVEVSGGPLDEKELSAATNTVLGHDYSEYSAEALAKSALSEAYENEGYPQPHFSSPIAVMHDPASLDAGQGVTVKFLANAGRRYTWGGAAFSGNHVYGADELAKMAGMSVGEVARRNKTQEGWKQIALAMGHKGYVALAMHATPNYDDTARIVRFTVQMDEGPQFTMGELRIEETAPKVVKLISEAWKIERGQVYDLLAEHKFLAEDGPKAVDLSGTMRNHMTFKRTLHPETRTVDVCLEFQ